MAKEIKELIEKIQQEGIFAAESKARQIEEEAQKKAKEIILKAESQAKKTIAGAKEEAAKQEEAARVSLKQAGRDTLLSLRKEINAMLERIVVLRAKEVLQPHELAKIIASLIKEYTVKEKAGIEILLKKEDLEKLEKELFADLKDAARKGITLKPAEDITGGFIISFDSGKSHYDFTDKALAGYIAGYLQPKLAEVLKGALP